MNWRRLFAATTMLLAYLAAEPSAALPVISTGPFTPSSPTFVVPIQITGASDLVTWQFELAFDPTDLQANSVTEGEFTSSNGQFLTLFIPGVIDNTTGLISLVAGAYLDLPPGPSGDGVLAAGSLRSQPTYTSRRPHEHPARPALNSCKLRSIQSTAEAYCRVWQKLRRSSFHL